jgi:hypothetical protein
MHLCLGSLRAGDGRHSKEQVERPPQISSLPTRSQAPTVVLWLKYDKQSALRNGLGICVISGPERAFGPGLSVSLAVILMMSYPLGLAFLSYGSTTALYPGSTSSKRLHTDHPLGRWR